MKTSLLDVAVCLPEEVVTNKDLQRQNPGWDMGQVVARGGVSKRHIAAAHETALDLGQRAAEQLLNAHAGLRGRIDGLIFCTQSPDYVMPPNACVLHKLLNLSDDVLAFDINLACSGFPYGAALAQGLILSRQASHVLLVNADTYSRYIHPQDRSTRVLFGDGAAATCFVAEPAGHQILDICCGTAGSHYDKFIIPAGGCRMPRSDKTSIAQTDQSGNVRTPEHIHMNGMGILGFVNSKIPEHVKRVLARNDLTPNDVNLFVFHQASKMALDSLTRLLQLDSQKVYCNLQEIGNTVSASIPIALKEAFEAKRIEEGDIVLLCGFGVGLSWGSVLVRW